MGCIKLASIFNCVCLFFVSIAIIRGFVSRDGQGLGNQGDVPDGNSAEDEYDAYRKRMMLAYKFRPNPLVIIQLSANTLTS